nr:F0F1 ATP synthase subunit B [Arsenicicoccus piscis]
MAAVAVGLPAAGEEESAHGNPIIPHMPEFIWSLIIFGLLWFVVAKYVSPRLEQAYQARKAAIEGGMSQAEEAQREANEAKARYEAQLEDARDEAARIREEAKEQGAAIIAEMRAQAGAEASRIIESAHRQIEADRQQASVSLRSEVGRLSIDLASRIVGESLHEETRQKGIVDRFLAELESGAITPRSASGDER